MPLQYFALDSTHADYTAAQAALIALNTSKRGYAPTFVERATTYDSVVKIVAAIVDEEDLTGALADFADAAVPNALCQHRWYTAGEFRISGFHQLGETVRNVFGVAGRSYRVIRPQQGYSRTADNYGDGTGTNWYNAANGAQDPVVISGTGTAYPTGTDNFYADGLHYRWDDGAANPGGGATGVLNVVDANGLGAAGETAWLSDPGWPGMMWGSYRNWDRISGLPWEEFDPTNHIYVCGGAHNGLVAGNTIADLDVEDITLDSETLLQRHSLYGKASLSDLNGTGGRGRFHAPTGMTSGLCESVQVWNGSAFTDYTTLSRPAPGNVEALALSAPNDAAIYIGRSQKFNEVFFHPNGGIFQIGGTGVWEYYKSDTTWATIPTISDGTSGITVNGHVRFLPPTDWATVAVNTATLRYYIRWRKTGGTVTQAASIEWIDHTTQEPWLAVRVFDGTSTYTDVTFAACDNTSNNVEAMAAGAANNAALLWCAERPFSQILIDISQVRIGGTVAYEYSKGSGVWGTVGNINDPTVGLTTGTAEAVIQFNPKIDWATDTVDGVTGYWMRLRKTAGTVTTAARLDSTMGFLDRCLYIHRWNDGAAVEGVCGGNLSGGAQSGFGFNITGKGNFRWERFRSLAGQTTWSGGTNLTLSGSQFAFGTMGVGGGTPNWVLKASDIGVRWWSIDDHLHKSAADPFIQDLISDIQRAVDDGVNLADDGWEPDVTAFDHRLPNCTDVLLFGTGPYLSGSASWGFTFGGFKLRRTGQVFAGLNDPIIVNVTTPDKHMIASLNATHNAVLEHIYCERGTLMIDMHAQAEADNDAPTRLNSSGRQNLLFAHGYCSTFGGTADAEQPTNGIKFESNPDTGKYDNGTGGDENNLIAGWGFKDMREGATASGGAFSVANPGAMIARYCLVDNSSGWGTSGGFNNNGPRSTNAHTATAGGSLTEFTQWIRHSGGAWAGVMTWNGTSFTDVTAAAASSTANDFEMIGAGAADGSYCAFIGDHPFRVLWITIRQRRVGGSGEWRYSKGAGVYGTATMTSDTTVGFSAGGIDSQQFPQVSVPADWAPDTVNGVTGYVLRWEKTSGTVTTAARGNQSQVYLRYPLFPTGAAGECFYMGEVFRVNRTWTFQVAVAGVGSPTLAWEYSTDGGTNWAAVSNLSDATSGFTATGTRTVTHNRPAATQVTVGSKTIYAIRCRIVSGSFSTIPRVDSIRTYFACGDIDVQKCRFKNIDTAAGCRVGVMFHGVGTALTNTGVVIDQDNIIELMPGQSAATTFYAILATPAFTLAGWQALSKPALTTDAEVDSVFGVGNTLVGP